MNDQISHIKQHYDFVIVILVYRNINDLSECLASIAASNINVKAVIVNSYYNDEIKLHAELIAHQYKGDFINIENKGYSYGNNIGIKYANDNYCYEYIIVSNPDIIINDFSIDGIKSDIIAPKIVAATGKKQNPLKPWHSRMVEDLVYLGYKMNIPAVRYFGLGINHVYRDIFMLLFRVSGGKYNRIYAPHGCFILLSENAIKNFGTQVFDENMFLFSEELVLAHRAKEKKLKITYTQQIKIRHKEDGSMKLTSIPLYNEGKKAYIYYYLHYREKRKSIQKDRH